MLFYKATSNECEKVMNILSTYEEASGQKINKNKTACFIFFFLPSKSTKDKTREMIKGVLGVQEIKQYDKYSGLPSFVGREKK